MTFRLPIYAAAAALLLAAQPVHHAMADSQDYSVEQIKQDTSELLTSLKEYSVEQKEEAVDAVEDALDEIDDRMVELQTRIDENWDSMSEATREKSKNAMADLREQRAKVAGWFDDLKDSSKDAWDDVKDGFSDAYNDMSEAWNNAERELSGSS